MQTIDLRLQATAFVSLYRRHGHRGWRATFDRWADNKSFDDAERAVIEEEAKRIHTSGEFDRYMENVENVLKMARRTALAAAMIRRRAEEFADIFEAAGTNWFCNFEEWFVEEGIDPAHHDAIKAAAEIVMAERHRERRDPEAARVFVLALLDDVELCAFEAAHRAAAGGSEPDSELEVAAVRARIADYVATLLGGAPAKRGGLQVVR